MHPHNDYRIGQRSITVVIAVNILLCVCKWVAGVWGGSKALIADSFHTASDVVTSLVVLIGLRYGSIPPDSHHPYGHGRAESIAAKILSLALILFGVTVIVHSARSLTGNSIESPHRLTLWVAVASIVVKEIQFRYALYYGRVTGSTSLTADAYHHRSDVYTSLGALVGIIGARMGYPLLDPLAGCLVGGIVVHSGLLTLHRAFDELLDKALEPELMDAIREAVSSVKDVRHISILKARKLGLDILVDLTIEVDAHLSVVEAHRITARVRRAILRQVAHTRDVLIHVEPYAETSRQNPSRELCRRQKDDNPQGGTYEC